MPAIRHASKRKAPPAGFSDIEDDLLVFSNKMKDAENASTVNVPRHKVHWPIFQITHQRSRYVYELYYEKEAISKELYEWLLKEGYADKMLIAKWKKMGYEKVCNLPVHPFSISCSRMCGKSPKLIVNSYAASAASKPRKRISTQHVYVEFPKRK